MLERLTKLCSRVSLVGVNFPRQKSRCRGHGEEQLALTRLLQSCVCLCLGSLLLTGCTETRSEPTATVSGKVTYQGTAVATGARLILDDKSKGVRMTFKLTDGGSYTIPETAKLPVGTYAVGLLPPAGSEAASSEADYDALMSNPRAGGTTKTSTSDSQLPEKVQDPATSGKTIEISEGNQTVDIAFE